MVVFQLILFSFLLFYNQHECSPIRRQHQHNITLATFIVESEFKINYFFLCNWLSFFYLFIICHQRQNLFQQLNTFSAIRYWSLSLLQTALIFTFFLFLTIISLKIMKILKTIITSPFIDTFSESLLIFTLRKEECFWTKK